MRKFAAFITPITAAAAGFAAAYFFIEAAITMSEAQSALHQIFAAARGINATLFVCLMLLCFIWDNTRIR